jgi:predicted RNA-binding Zn-ribbon protein involved in translation (DUF1610 family)
MAQSRQQRPPVRPESAAVLQSHSTADLRHHATSGGPTWFLEARPLVSCHDHDEYAIECPESCGREAIVWRARPGEKGSGYACACGAKGPLWRLLGAAA